MGFCSATGIFDDVGAYVLNSNLAEQDQAGIMRVLAIALETEDWDCQSDSVYYDHPIVRQVMRELHPDWDELSEGE